MAKQAKLHIPKPCAQPWHQMQPDAHGRYCTHCAKSVVDFTKFDDAQLLAYFK